MPKYFRHFKKYYNYLEVMEIMRYVWKVNGISQDTLGYRV